MMYTFCYFLNDATSLFIRVEVEIAQVDANIEK